MLAFIGLVASGIICLILIVMLLGWLFGLFSW